MVSKKARKADHRNAMKGVRIWHKTSPTRRRIERDLGHHRWGFSGKSPNTRKRKYKK